MVIHHFPAEQPQDNNIGPYWVWIGRDQEAQIAEWHTYQGYGGTMHRGWMTYGASADYEGLHSEDVDGVTLWAEMEPPTLVRIQLDNWAEVVAQLR